MVVLAGKGGEARVMLHGGHVVHFQPFGQAPVLWMSQKSWFEAGKPIRGGVPVCFPWFGASTHIPNAPGHGIARLKEWELISSRQLPDGRAEVVLAIRSDDSTREYWAHEFVLMLIVSVGPTLTLSLTATNIDRRPVTITEALHTYFAVSDIRQVKVHGLEGLEYIDTVGGKNRLARQDDQPVTFAAETDRDYLNTAATAVLEDPGAGRSITIEKTGSNSTVIWNPWIAKAAKMPDFGDDEWPGMLCIETANVGADAITLKPGKSHIMQAKISVSPRAALP
jgi:D-hexose-6-phosphate mutarotase